MKLLFKQRLFSWISSYDIYYEDGRVAYTVQGRFSWGHKLEIYDAAGQYSGMVKEEVWRFKPTFHIYDHQNYFGRIWKEWTFFTPRYTVECNGWQVQGDLMGWDYQIINPAGQLAAQVSKQLFRMTDTYTIEYWQPEDELLALMVVLAIDAANARAKNN